MKVITEKRLREYKRIAIQKYIESADDLLSELINACEELNQWQPIETAPKDREILVYAPAYQDLRFLISVCKWHESAGFCIDELRQPTHWMELPKPPRED